MKIEVFTIFMQVLLDVLFDTSVLIVFLVVYLSFKRSSRLRSLSNERGRMPTSTRPSSDEQFRFAFSEVFSWREIELMAFGDASFSPQPFLRLPDMRQCEKLDIVGINGFADVAGVLQASDIRDWLEGGASSSYSSGSRRSPAVSRDWRTP